MKERKEKGGLRDEILFFSGAWHRSQVPLLLSDYIDANCTRVEAAFPTFRLVDEFVARQPRRNQVYQTNLGV